MSNDRLKFRVWYDPQCDGLEPRYFYDVQDVYDGSIEGLGWISCFGDLLDTPEQYTVEQCTGLKDKNGKLIFEGDVFEAIVLNSCACDENIGKRIRGQVAYFTDSACFTFAAYSSLNLGQIEIIGNIHEMELEQ